MRIVGLDLECIGRVEATARIMAWAGDGQPHAVAFVNTHMTMEARDDPAFSAALASFDLRLPDGMPVVWTARLLGAKAQPQVDGPTTTLHLLTVLAESGTKVGFYGSTEQTIEGIRSTLAHDHPGLAVAFARPAPFARDDAPETQQDLADMRAAGVEVLFVGLGCPKQERWIARRKAEGAPFVMLGVGQALDILAGTKRRAPALFRGTGLEWLYRFAHEPRRLARRVLVLGPRYMWHAGRQVLTRRSTG